MHLNKPSLGPLLWVCLYAPETMLHLRELPLFIHGLEFCLPCRLFACFFTQCSGGSADTDDMCTEGEYGMVRCSGKEIATATAAIDWIRRRPITRRWPQNPLVVYVQFVPERAIDNSRCRRTLLITNRRRYARHKTLSSGLFSNYLRQGVVLQIGVASGGRYVPLVTVSAAVARTEIASFARVKF